MKHLALFFILSLTTGCVTEKIKRISIISEPIGADISMNGEYLGRAPLIKTLRCICESACEYNFGWKPNGISFIAAGNSQTGGGESQSLYVNPCTDDELTKALMFNMNLQRIPTKNQIDLNINNKNN